MHHSCPTLPEGFWLSQQHVPEAACAIFKAPETCNRVLGEDTSPLLKNVTVLLNYLQVPLLILIH